MPEYWLDTDSLITPHRGPYRFSYGTILWDFLEEKAHEGIIGCPEIILIKELSTASPTTEKDRLEIWARELRGILFLPADWAVQKEFSAVANYVQSNRLYKQQWIPDWLTKADPWVISYPIALGGKIVTFEKPSLQAKKPKIPDVAGRFGIQCLSIWEMLEVLGFKN
jgi:hypothetical protein